MHPYELAKSAHPQSMRLSSVIAILLLLISVTTSNYAQAQGGYQPGKAMPAGGFVPNADTAERIAEAILVPIYGSKIVDEEKPFHAELSGDIWTVRGTFKRPWFTLRVGGVAIVQIDKNDGRIILVAHEK